MTRKLFNTLVIQRTIIVNYLRGTHTTIVNIIEKLVTFKRITHGIAIEIYQTCSNIAKTNAKSQMFKLPKCQIYFILFYLFIFL